MKSEDLRISWDEYFLEFALLASKRTTCTRRAVGAVIVKDNRIISTGYNGAPKGVKHCFETGCLRSKLKVPSGKNHELCRGLHAEQNAIIFAANSGGDISDATMYVTTQPCVICAKMIINANIKRVVYISSYEDDFSIELMRSAGIQLEKFRL